MRNLFEAFVAAALLRLQVAALGYSSAQRVPLPPGTGAGVNPQLHPPITIEQGIPTRPLLDGTQNNIPAAP
jgi:hypothetical protein